MQKAIYLTTSMQPEENSVKRRAAKLGQNKKKIVFRQTDEAEQFLLKRS